MSALNHTNSLLEKFCNDTIKQQLGDISGLPKDLTDYVRKVYREFIAGYLNMLRQKENKPVDWTPETFLIDSELADEMRHFFSDYQHVTREFYRLNQKMDRLQEFDKDKQPDLYQYEIDNILRRFNRQVSPGDDFEKTA
jgi:hypothetical protein